MRLLKAQPVLPAYQRLVREGFLKPTDKVVMFNTGSGLKYIDVIAQALKIGMLNRKRRTYRRQGISAGYSAVLSNRQADHMAYFDKVTVALCCTASRGYRNKNLFTIKD